MATKQNVYELARELSDKVKEVGFDKAYDWFTSVAIRQNLTSAQQFHVVLLAGDIKEHLTSEPPKTVRKAPWEIEREGYQKFKGMSEPDKQRYLNGEFKPETKPEKPKRLPSNSCMRDAKKALGLPPYDQPGNYLVGDGYFSLDCRRKYGDRMWDYACELLRKERR